MIDTRTLPGHDAARALALAVASLRSSPITGLECLSTAGWDRIHSISWSGDLPNPTITVETMQQRQPNGSRTVLRAVLPQDHPSRHAFDSAVEGLIASHPEATLSVRVMVAYIGWEVCVSQPVGADAEQVTPWGAEESLALTSGEWSDFIVQRDADDRERGMYAANALIRVAGRLEHMVAEHEDGYYRHWTRVDAEILRRAALREHPSLDPDFVPRIGLAA